MRTTTAKLLMIILLLTGIGPRPGDGAEPLLNADPWETAAWVSMQSMAEALVLCALDTTYYVSLESLDDLPYTNTHAPFDYVNNGGGLYVIRPAEGRFRTQRINLLTGYNQWNGPYITYQSGTIQEGTTPYDQGSPLDPWGNPYYFFTPLGLVRGDQGTITLELYGDAFDRYTIVSLGPDGIMSSDDLIYSFEGGISILAISSLRGAAVKSIGSDAFSAPAGSSVTLRGQNLGSSQSDGLVMLNDQALTTVSGWSNREITFTLPGRVGGPHSLTVRHGSSVSNPLSLTLLPVISGVQNWAFYQ